MLTEISYSTRRPTTAHLVWPPIRRPLRWGPSGFAYLEWWPASPAVTRSSSAWELAVGRNHQAVITQTVTGLGGVGKTQLAAAYAHLHAERYQVVAWVRAEDGGIADLAELAIQLRLPVEGLTPDEQASRALRWLESTDRSWLLLLDNVGSPTQLERLCPSSGPGQVLVTSRRRDFDEFGPVIRLGVFDQPIAVAYLLERTGRADEDGAAGRLALALGCLPLALSHAGAYCAIGTSFEAYLGLLGSLPAGELYDANPEAFYNQTVATTWQVSISAAGDTASLAGPALDMAAYLAPEAIPRSLFDALTDGNGASQPRELVAGLTALHRYSLAEVTDTTVSVHRLLQKVVRDNAQARGDHGGGRAALTAVSDAFPYETDLPRLWPCCEQLRPHALVLADTISPSQNAARDLVRLLNRTTDYLLKIGGGSRAMAAAEIAVDAATNHLGLKDFALTVSARSNLGLAYESVGRTAEAVTIHEQVVADSEQLLGIGHPDTLTAQHNLAVSYGSAARRADAIAIFEHVVAASERQKGPEHPHTLIARNQLASSYESAGRTAEAIAMHEQLVADSERLLGHEHPDTLVAWANLAISYQSAGRTVDAIAIKEQVLADSERLLEPEHPNTLNARNQLGFSYELAGRTADAIALKERAAADCQRILGSDHPQTLSIRHNLAYSYQAAGRTVEAIAISEQVAADYERLWGPEHPNTLGPGTTWPSATRRRGARPRPSPSASRLWPTVNDCWGPTTPRPTPPWPSWPPPTGRRSVWPMPSPPRNACHLGRRNLRPLSANRRIECSESRPLAGRPHRLPCRRGCQPGQSRKPILL